MFIIKAVLRMVIGEESLLGDKFIIPTTPTHLAPDIMMDISILCDINTVFSLKQTSVSWLQIMDKERIWKKILDKSIVFDDKPEEMTYKAYAQIIREKFLYDEFSRVVYHSAMEKRFIRMFITRARLSSDRQKDFAYVHRYYIDTGCLPYLRDIYENAYRYNALVKECGYKVMKTENLFTYFRDWSNDHVREVDYSNMPYTGIGSLDYPDHVSFHHFLDENDEYLIRGILSGYRKFFAIRFYHHTGARSMPFVVILFERYSQDNRLAFGKRQSALNICTGIFSVNTNAPELLMMKKLMVFGKAKYFQKCTENPEGLLKIGISKLYKKHKLIKISSS